MGVPFFVPGWHGSFGPVGTVRWGVCNTPLHGTRPNSQASADARMRYAPQVPGQTWQASLMPPANLAGISDAFSALLSDSIFAAVFGDAKSDGPVRDVKRESSERLEQCPLLYHPTYRTKESTRKTCHCRPGAAGRPTALLQGEVRKPAGNNNVYRPSGSRVGGYKRNVSHIRDT